MKKVSYIKYLNDWYKFWTNTGKTINSSHKNMFSKTDHYGGFCWVPEIDAEVILTAIISCKKTFNLSKKAFWFSSRAHRINFLLFLAVENNEL